MRPYNNFNGAMPVNVWVVSECKQEGVYILIPGGGVVIHESPQRCLNGLVQSLSKAVCLRVMNGRKGLGDV